MFYIIATCKEVRGESGYVVTPEDRKVIVVNEEWVDSTCYTYYPNEALPKNTKFFPTREAAEAYATYLDSDEAKNFTAWWRTWHPWFIKPKSWEVREFSTEAEKNKELAATDTVPISRELLARVKAALVTGEQHCWQSAREAHFEGGKAQYSAEALACQQAVRDLNDAEMRSKVSS